MSTICLRSSLVQRVEDDHVVEPVQELGPEVLLDRDLEPFLHLLVAGRLVAAAVEAEDVRARGDLGAGVGGHDDDRVLEIDVAAEAVGQPAFFHDLEQHVVDVGVGLLDLVRAGRRRRAGGGSSRSAGRLPRSRRSPAGRRSAGGRCASPCTRDMSIWIRASASPNMNSARALASSVLPTPVGPAKMKQPIGRLGSLSPARLRRTASLIRLIASAWRDDPLLEVVFHLQQPGRSPRSRDG